MNQQLNCILQELEDSVSSTLGSDLFLLTNLEALNCYVFQGKERANKQKGKED